MTTPCTLITWKNPRMTRVCMLVIFKIITKVQFTKILEIKKIKLVTIALTINLKIILENLISLYLIKMIKVLIVIMEDIVTQVGLINLVIKKHSHMVAIFCKKMKKMILRHLKKVLKEEKEEEV